MITYPANEQKISEVERGHSCEAIVPQQPGKPLAAGDSILFALSKNGEDREPSYVRDGDSVLVVLTGVTDMGAADPGTGQPFVRLVWTPPGLENPPAPASRRSTGSRRSRGMF